MAAPGRALLRGLNGQGGGPLGKVDQIGMEHVQFEEGDDAKAW